MTKEIQTITAPKTALSVYGAEQENLKALAISLASKSEEQILSGTNLSEEMSLLKWQGGIKEDTILDNRIMAGYKDQGLLLKVILAALTWFVEGFKEGARMRTSDIFKMGLYIFEYKAESLEDVVLCFKMAEAERLKDPDTGKKIKRYATMDLELLKKYWHAYLDFKAGLRELRRNEEKYKENGGDFRTEEDTRLIELERKGEFLKEYRAATGQVERWRENDQNTFTPLQAVVANKFGKNRI